MLENFGNLGYQIGALGIIAFTIAFLVVVRWWTDILGRVIAGVFSATSAVLIMTTLRMFGYANAEAFFAWRAAVFWLFGIGVWSGLGTFLWSQFMARRVNPRGVRSKVTTPQTRREHRNEEVDLADRRPHRDVGPHDRPGGDG
jgi:hypothetical protein